MTTILFIGAVALGFMLAEMRISLRHERRLLARGAVQPRGDVYAWMSLLYPASFVCMVAEGLLRSTEAPAAPDPTGPAWLVSGVLLFAVSKWLKYWAIGALGDRWTFKVIVEPGRPLVRSGPYRYVRHPNYLAVAGEFAGTAMMVGAWTTGPLCFAVFGALVWARVRFEERALAAIGGPP